MDEADAERAAAKMMLGGASVEEMEALVRRLNEALHGVPVGRGMLALTGLAGMLGGRHFSVPSQPIMATLVASMTIGWETSAADRAKGQVAGHA